MSRDALKKKSLKSDLTHRSRKKKRAYFKRSAIIASVVIVVLVSGLALLSHVDAMQIRTIELAGNRLVSIEQVEESIDAELDSSYAFLFSKRNGLIYPRRMLEQKLLAEFPRLIEASLSVDQSQTLRVDVRERTGLYLWCSTEVLSGDGLDSPCYFLDEDGIVFSKAPYFSGPVYFTFYHDAAGVGAEEALSTAPVDPVLFASIVHAHSILSSLGVETNGAVLGDTSFELLVRSQEMSGYRPRVIMPMDEHIDVLLDNLASALLVEPLKSARDNEFVGLEYADLRFDNRVVYKFR